MVQPQYPEPLMGLHAFFNLSFQSVRRANANERHNADNLGIETGRGARHV